MVRTYITVQFNQEFATCCLLKMFKNALYSGDLPETNREMTGSVGIRYFISSKELTPTGFGQLFCGYWGVESMQWLLDSVMKEVDSLIIYNHAAENLSRIRQMRKHL